MIHRNYTDKQQVEEFNGDWDDLISPDEYIGSVDDEDDLIEEIIATFSDEN